MKLKLLDILNSKNILEKLGERKDFDGLTTLKISRNIDKLNPERVKFDEVNRELIIKLGEKKEVEIEGKKEERYQVLPTNMDEYFKQLNEILQQEMEIDILLLDPIKITGFSPLELMAVQWMFQIIE